LVFAMPLLDSLPVDNEIPPGDKPTVIEMLLGRVDQLLHFEETWIALGCLALILAVRSTMAHGRKRAAKAEARRRFEREREQEDEVLSELAALRRARAARVGAGR
jgi:hypothetical protein